MPSNDLIEESGRLANNVSSSEESSNSRKGRDQILAEYEEEEEDLGESMDYYSRLKSRAAEFMNVIATINSLLVTTLFAIMVYFNTTFWDALESNMKAQACNHNFHRTYAGFINLCYAIAVSSLSSLFIVFLFFLVHHGLRDTEIVHLERRQDRKKATPISALKDLDEENGDIDTLLSEAESFSHSRKEKNRLHRESNRFFVNNCVDPMKLACQFFGFISITSTFILACRIIRLNIVRTVDICRGVSSREFSEKVAWGFFLAIVLFFIAISIYSVWIDRQAERIGSTVSFQMRAGVLAAIVLVALAVALVIAEAHVLGL